MSMEDKGYLIKVYDPSRRMHEYYTGPKNDWTDDPEQAHRFDDPQEAQHRIDTLKGKISIFDYEVVPYQPKEKLYGEHPADPLFPKDALHALMVQAGYLATRLSVYFQLSEKPHTKRDEIEAWGEVIKKMDNVTELIAEVREQPTPKELLDELQNVAEMAEESPLLQLDQFVEHYSNIRKVMAKAKLKNPQLT